MAKFWLKIVSSSHVAKDFQLWQSLLTKFQVDQILFDIGLEGFLFSEDAPASLYYNLKWGLVLENQKPRISCVMFSKSIFVVSLVFDGKK